MAPFLILLVITALLLQPTKCVPTNETINYYSQLIIKEISRSMTYKLPTDSRSFESSFCIPFIDGLYDYIVIGAGYTGSVIASRLTENPRIRVLLLETGGPESQFSDIPRFNEYLRGLEFNWNLKTLPQSTCCYGMVNQQCSIPSGKGLGGSSILNDLSYERGNKVDYDGWCNNGNSGWCYDSLLSLFKKSENFRIRDGDADYHGTEGMLNVEPVKLCNPQLDAFIQANVELGREEVDYNGIQQLGVSRMHKNTINGTRQSVAKAFLSNARDRTNLEISQHSFATKILIYFNKAIGVQFSRKGHIYKAKALREVIIAQGAAFSAQTLMLSGIGPKAHLRSFGISVIKDLPVGENLQDHPAYLALHFVTNYTEPIASIQENVEEYLNGFGRYTVGGNTQGVAFVKLNQSDSSEQPDIQFVMVPSNNTNQFEQRSYNYDNETYNSVWAKLDPRRSFTIHVILLHPKSRGTVKLQSRSPYIYPSIDSNLFSDSNGADIDNLYKGIQMAIQLADTDAFKKLNTQLFDSTVPACKVFEYRSKEYWYCQLKYLALPLGHMVGTCKMGQNPRCGSVVDHNLRVHGIRNLRVADSSIMPSIVSGDPSVASIMIGEKVSELIHGG